MKNKGLKILLLTDKLSLGGAETHILTLYRSLTELGHSVTVASSGGSLSKNINHIRIDLVSRSPARLLSGFFSLFFLVKREGFDIIHAHSRLPAVVASFISRILKIPFVTTAHARFKSDPLRRSLSRWGDYSIAVSEDIRLYLINFYSLSPHRITVIENAVDFSSFPPLPKPEESSAREIRLLFLSRLDSDCSLCAELLCKLAPRLFTRYPSVRIVIGGGGERLSYIRSLASEINSSHGVEIISVIGEVTDVSAFLRSGTLFVGVSRAALEAAASALPVIVAGNEGFFGHLTRENHRLALASNFCARGMQMPDAELLFSAACSIIDSLPEAFDEAHALRSALYATLDAASMARRTEKFYFDAIRSKKSRCSKAPKTLLLGYYGYSNLGDDALLSASISRSYREFSSSVGAFTAKPKRDSLDFSIPCFRRKNPFALFYRLAKADRLILGGGTLFQTSTSKRSFVYYLLVLRLAQLLKKETLVYANGIGEIYSRTLRRFLFSTLGRCSFVGLRDSASLSLFKRELPDFENVDLETDLALYLAPSATTRANFLIFNALKQKSAHFFAVFPHFAASRFSRFELQLAIRMAKKKRLAPVYIACSPQDLFLCRSLARKFGGSVLSNLTFSDLLSLLPFSSLVISMRYHPLLAARTLRLPLIAVGDDIKLSEFKG